MYLPHKDLWQDFLEHPEFELLLHEFHKLQHTFLRVKGEKTPIELNVNAMKKYFLILSGHSVETYLPIKNEVLEGRQVRDVLDDVLLLEKNRLLMIGVRSQSGWGHCIVVSLKDDNLMIYDSNIGLYRFSNLFEAKKYLLGYFSILHPT